METIHGDVFRAGAESSPFEIRPEYWLEPEMELFSVSLRHNYTTVIAKCSGMMTEENNPMFRQAHMSSSHASEASTKKENQVNLVENVPRTAPTQHINSAFTTDVAPLKVIDAGFD